MKDKKQKEEEEEKEKKKSYWLVLIDGFLNSLVLSINIFLVIAFLLLMSQL